MWCDLNAKVIRAFYTATSEPVSETAAADYVPNQDHR
ncbi:hypothetical protein Ga0074812_13350 [Parafrankia irregularis]|uniref:Uncharacterized protein n=1 Tax=Parafrankia irregularis TaxID=795642 RepID=A0A0S4QZE2_9ACTN|nr:hypothetical protein Ga0074812_13350 [Parafrankia irregularis]